MHDGSSRIIVQDLSKSFGPVHAVQRLSFAVEPGSVTGFLGPNGSGKTTTLRMILGLVSASTGTATISGRPFHQLENPATVVGAVLEAQSFHPSRTARDHLRAYAAAMNVPDQQADKVLELVGLTSAANRKAGGFSLGMRQRLALATALLGDPQVLVLDEPANGLDPGGIAWLRDFLKSFASTGRTVLVSSHLLREMEEMVDQVVIVSRGQCVFHGHLDQLRAQQRSRVLVQAADPTKLATALQQANLAVESMPDGRLAVLGTDTRTVADLGLRANVAVYGLEEEKVDLEQLFFQLTSSQYVGGQYPAQPPQGPGQWGPPGGGGAPMGYQQYPPTGPASGSLPSGYQQQPGGSMPPGYQQQQPGGSMPPGYQQQQGGNSGFGGYT